MSAFVLVLFFLWVLARGLPAQDYRFTRQDGVYRLIEPRETIVLAPPVERAALYEFLALDPTEAAPLSTDTNTRPGFEREDPTRFYRKGRVGDWRIHFTPSAKRWFLDEAGDLLVRLEYESDNRW